MKTKIYTSELNSERKIRLALVFILSVIIISASCKKSDNSSDVIFTATLNGASETPPNSSLGTGNATLTYNKDTKIFTVVVNFNGVVATASHIHKGAQGVPGDVVFGFTPPITSPINYTSPVLTADQEADLYANLYYVNVHSTAFPGGEIRGQLLPQ